MTTEPLTESPPSEPEAPPSPSPADIAAADAANQITGGGGAGATFEAPRITRWTLGSGIVLALRPVSPRLLRQASEQIPRPEMPMVMNTAKDEMEPNPDSPSYQQAVRDWQFEYTDAGLKLGLILGTSCESVPEGWYRPEEDGWIDEIKVASEVIGKAPPAIRTEGKGRYLDWLLYHAAASDEDNFVLSRVFIAATFPTEEEVSRALASFRDSAARLRDLDLVIAGSSGYRD